jgi:N-acetylglucosaminyldiphosphoundecaprenol N-acetyl-beta-D-mannosaminyltransferase
MSLGSLVPHDNDPPTVPLLGLDVAAVSERETIDYVLDALVRRRGGWICAVNLDVLRQSHASSDVRELVATADLVVADGMPLLWAGELQGSPLPERVAGSSLILTLAAAAADAGASVFLLGGKPGTADAAGAELTRLSPHLRVAGTLCPPFGFEHDAAWMDRIEQQLRESSPQIVYVGLGFPKQERLILELRGRLPNTWFVALGGSFSFVAGDIPRAPVTMQRLGLEWLYRLAQEPKRLYRRYLFHGIPFLVQLLASAVASRFRHAARAVH